MLPLLVTAAIIVHDGKVLLTRRRAGGAHPLQWEFPGGKLEEDEDPRDCVVREIAEELGMEISVQEIFDTVYYRYPQRPVLILAFRCRWERGGPLPLQVAEYRWVSPQHIGSLDMLPADYPLVERLLAMS